jgi:hypothetical protein
VTPERNGPARVEEIYVNRGEEISAASIALRYKNQLILGPVFDSRLLVCTLP